MMGCHVLYGCRPLLSQVRELWKGMHSHLTNIQAELHIPRAECDLLKICDERYEKGYHPVWILQHPELALGFPGLSAFMLRNCDL